jgi:hypothetical protein
MGLSGKVYHGVRLQISQGPAEYAPVADVRIDKPIPWITRNLLDGFEVARVSQLIDVDQRRCCME